MSYLCTWLLTLVGVCFSVSLKSVAATPLSLSFDLNDEPDMGMGLEPVGIHTAPQIIHTPAMQAILNDDIGSDFKLTEGLLGGLEDILNKFAHQENFNALTAGTGNLVSTWIQKILPGAQIVSGWRARELDIVYATYQSQFKPLIKQIVNERPANLNLDSLAYRCDKNAELGHVVRMGHELNIYKSILDVFFSDLYGHCLRRKLALLRLHQIEPTQIVRELVDIYLEIPAYSGASGNMEPYVTHLAQSANAFKLDQAVARLGPLEHTVGLLMSTGSGLLGQDDARHRVERFVHECNSYAARLNQVWSNFDSVAKSLSNNMNELETFNSQIKLTVPQLAYAVICSQLASTAARH